MAQQQPNRYYRPYISDSEESETDTDTDTDTSSISSRQPNYRQFASDLQLIKAAGPNFPTNEEQIRLQRPETMASYESDASGVEIPKFQIRKTLVTSVIMLDSRDRDVKTYLQPTNLTLRLPRTYKYITNFQIIQINLLSSFFYFRADKNNLTVTIQEQDRYIQDVPGVIKTAENSPLIKINTTIREGTYTIDTLRDELNLQLNRTPIFYDYLNGFIDFAQIFVTSGDYSIIFNQPGDNYYDALNNVFISAPKMLDIIQKYFSSQYAGLSSYSSRQLKAAYYYPVLKEILLDPEFGITKVNLNITDITYLNYPVRTDAEVFERCIYKFEGLNDTIVQQVIELNIPILDTYRLQHTFRYSLINKYNVSYSTNSNRITISSTSLNTSLLNLLTSQYNQFFAQQLSAKSLTFADYTVLNTTGTIYLAIITDMFNYIQTNLANYFGINYNTFSLLYFTNILNQLPLQQGMNSAGVKNSFTITNVDPFITNILAQFQQTTKPYWSEMRKLSNTYTNFDPSQSPYDPNTDTFDAAHTFTDINGIIYQNPILKSTNMVVNIGAAQYTVFTFRSLTRQTLKVTALPRPDKYRYPAYNLLTNQPAIFDNSYAFIDIIPQMDVSGATLITIPGFSASDNNFGKTADESINFWSTRTISLFHATNAAYFTFVAPRPSSSPGTYKYRMGLVLKTTISTPLIVFLYHDRGAFMADISDARQEKPIHYIQSATYTGIEPVLSFNVYAQHQYYVLVRSVELSPNTTPFIISPYCINKTDYLTLTTTIDSTFDPLIDPKTRILDFNYLSLADPDFLRLPSGSNLWSKTPGVDSNYYVIPGNSYVNIGYDANGVSSDLTDYFGSNSTRIDPVSGYIFKVGAGYNSQSKTYLDIDSAFGSGNQILTSNSVPLTTLIPLAHETVIAHWYSQVFIPNTANQIYVNEVNYSEVLIGNTLYSYPYVQDIVYPTIFSKSNTNSESQLFGYNFTDNKLSLGNGVIGISLIPDDGIWDVKRIMLRSSYIDPTFDSNRNIKYLGIFPASVLSGKINSQVHLSKALMTFELGTVNIYTQGEGLDNGTYYEWTKTSGIQYLYGYAQTPGKMIPDINAYYSIVPFTEDGILTTYSLISGSLVPYPYYSDANASPTYLDGSSTPSGTYVITPQIKKDNPKFGPPIGYDQSQSKYEQSVPIGATLLQYLQAPVISSDPLACKVYTTDDISLTGIVGAVPYTNICFRVANHCLISRGGQYDIYSYKSNVEDQRVFTFETSITLDLFFMNNPETKIVGMSGNNSVFAVLGLSTLPYTGASKLVFAYTFFIETYNPITQVIELLDTIVINGPVYTPSGLPGTSTNPLLPQISGLDIPITSIVGDGTYVAYVMDPTSLALNTAIFIRDAESIGFNGDYLINKLILTSVTLPVITSTYTTISRVTYYTSLTTGLVVGGAITLTDTTSYDGLFIISSIAANTSFTVNSYTYFATNARGDIQLITAISVPGDGTVIYSVVNTIGLSTGEIVTVSGALPMINGTFTIQSSVLNTSFTVPFGSYTVTDDGVYGPQVTSMIIGDGGTVTYFVPDVTTFIVGDTVTFTNMNSPYDTSTAQVFSKNSSNNSFTVKNITAQSATATTQPSCVVLSRTVGVLTETAAIGASGYEIINVTSFNYNDNKGFTFMIEYGLWNVSTNTYDNRKSIGVTKGTPTLDKSQPFILVTSPTNYPGLPATYQLLQSPYEPLGRFYLAAKTPFITRPTLLNYPIRDTMIVSNFLYTNNPQYNQNGLFYVNSENILNKSENPLVGVNLSNIGAPSVFVSSNASQTPQMIRFNLIQDTNSSAAAAFGDFTLLQNPYDNKIILSYDMYDMIGIPTKTYSEVVKYGVTGTGYTSNAYYNASKQVIKNYTNIPMCPSQVLGGGGGSFWILFNEERSTSTYDSVWGNRGDTYDFPVTVSNAYQIFYPTQRIVMTKVGRSYNPITDISGILTPEYPHTAMFAYNSLSSLNADISTKWGLESNYISADSSVSKGFYFNACDLDIPLYPSSTPYYLALRGYSPSEKSQVMLRFSLPNRYDFGYVTIKDLSNEILLSQTSPLLFNSNYTNTIQEFNSNFIFNSNGRVFGSNVIAGYGGSNMTNINGFGEFMNKFSSLYKIYNDKIGVVNAINTATQSNLQQFIKSDLGAIIPINLRTRQRYTDPLVYSILWKSALPPQYVSVEDAWGLGWNLGFSKFDTQYLTTHVAGSFYKILDDYINLRLNPEFNMNHMDTGSKENLQVTQDTTGSLNSFYGKLLLNSFGSYSQTMISNPIVFQIPIPKIDKLTFAWYDNLGNIINNADCEWTTVIQIVEQVDIVTT